MHPKPIIAIDGPSGSGKSTLGEEVARRLGYLYFDSGVLYRAVTWLALERGVDPADETAVTELAQASSIDVTGPTVGDGRLYTVMVDGEDITWQIRSPQVDAKVSVVSAHRRLRRALLPLQREIAARGGVVMVGRDIGTVIAPDATLKVYLEASLAVRAERRYRQLLSQGYLTGHESVVDELRRRDEIDSQRAVAPLAVAADAVVVCSDEMTVEEEADLVLSLLSEALKGVSR